VISRPTVFAALALLPILAASILFPRAASAQAIALDHPLRCGRLVCYPVAGQPGKFRYLPLQPHVARDEAGRPEFSFLRYVQSAAGSGEGGVTQADGGGVVHFLMDYSVSDEERRGALAALREDNEDAELVGPVVFESGTFTLVSSVAHTEDGKENKFARRVLGVGHAPLLEGLKSAVSLHLTKLGSQILWESFQTATPDISVVLEMSYSGIRDPADTTITVDWDRVEQMADDSIDVGIQYYAIGLGFDYENFWKSARDAGAVVIETKGDMKNMQALIDRTYARLQDMLFEPAPPERYNEQQLQEASDQLSGLMQQGTANTRILDLRGGYKRREERHSGRMTFNYRLQTSDTVTTAMAGNIGGLYAEIGGNADYFRTVLVDQDEAFRRREIAVYVDALNAENFSNYVNSVTFGLRKKHGSGRVTYGEVVFNRASFQNGVPKTINYPWDGEPSVDAWLEYEYDVTWSFLGGKTYSRKGIKGTNAAVALTPPYQYREVEFVADPARLAAENVRLVSIHATHDFFGKTVNETINLVPAMNRLSEVRHFAVPDESKGLSYQITWTLNDQRRVASEPRTSDDVVIFCDELP
jgi:hypothetical protein